MDRAPTFPADSEWVERRLPDSTGGATFASLAMGQANVKHWIDDILPLLDGDEDPLGVDDFATHRLPLADAPHAYEIFQKKEDEAFKILLTP